MKRLIFEVHVIAVNTVLNRVVTVIKRTVRYTFFFNDPFIVFRHLRQSYIINTACVSNAKNCEFSKYGRGDMYEVGISRRNGVGGSLTYNVYDMVLYANDNSFSFVLDVHTISLVDVNGKSR